LRELIDQVTAVLVVPFTVAVNCAVWLGLSMVAAGLTASVMALGLTTAVAVANAEGSATEVAVMATFSGLGTLDGGVYMPEEESVPITGYIDQFTAGLPVPVTVATNC
jgi:hypothetical protein